MTKNNVAVYGMINVMKIFVLDANVKNKLAFKIFIFSI